MSKFTCEQCKDKFPTLAAGLKHAQKQHGLTRQQAQSERKLHDRKPRR